MGARTKSTAGKAAATKNAAAAKKAPAKKATSTRGAGYRGAGTTLMKNPPKGAELKKLMANAPTGTLGMRQRQKGAPTANEAKRIANIMKERGLTALVGGEGPIMRAGGYVGVDGKGRSQIVR